MCLLGLYCYKTYKFYCYKTYKFYKTYNPLLLALS